MQLQTFNLKKKENQNKDTQKRHSPWSCYHFDKPSKNAQQLKIKLEPSWNTLPSSFACQQLLHGSLAVSLIRCQCGSCSKHLQEVCDKFPWPEMSFTTKDLHRRRGWGHIRRFRKRGVSWKNQPCQTLLVGVRFVTRQTKVRINTSAAPQQIQGVCTILKHRYRVPSESAAQMVVPVVVMTTLRLPEDAPCFIYLRNS